MPQSPPLSGERLKGSGKEMSDKEMETYLLCKEKYKCLYHRLTRLEKILDQLEIFLLGSLAGVVGFLLTLYFNK